MRYTAILFVLVAMAGCNNAANNDAAKTPKADSPAVIAKKETPPPPPPMDSATASKKYMEYMTPGAMHKMLAASVGNWTTDVTMWMDEKTPPQKTTGTCENKMILGGRYLVSTNKSTMMGQPFEGIGTMAYDNAKKAFVSSWIDNMGTSIMFMEGQYDSSAKTLNMKGQWEDPIKGKMDVREVYSFADAKNQTLEFYGTAAGSKEMKWMELKMTRK